MSFGKIMCAGILLACSAQLVADDTVATPEPTGTIIAYRPASIVGAAVACPIRIEGEVIAELGRGKFVELDYPPGRYILTNKISSVEINLAAGETRYVRCKIKVGFLAGGAELQIVDKASFDEASDHLERKFPER
jgi:hypothetical protein